MADVLPPQDVQQLSLDEVAHGWAHHLKKLTEIVLLVTRTSSAGDPSTNYDTAWQLSKEGLGRLRGLPHLVSLQLLGCERGGAYTL